MFDLFKTILGPILKPLVDKIPDVNERRRLEAAAEAQLLGAMTSAVEGQLKINEAQAKHGSLFVAGARPGIMWICAAGLAWNFVLQPLLLWVAFIIPEGADLATAPRLDIGELMTLLMGMLGLGTMRSFEKKNGVARNSLGDKNGN